VLYLCLWISALQLNTEGVRWRVRLHLQRHVIFIVMFALQRHSLTEGVTGHLLEVELLLLRQTAGMLPTPPR